MKAEHRKELQKNELADHLSKWWKGTGEARSSQTFWVVLGAIVLIGVLVFAYRYYSETSQKNRAAVWKQIEEATTPDELKSIVDANRGTTVGRAAKAQLARIYLNDGLDNLPTLARRSKAISDIETGRELYRSLIDEAKGDALIQSEAMLATAKAEESLVGIPKADNASESRGSLDAALELYDKAAAQFPNSPEGKQATDRAKEIRENRKQIEEFYTALGQHYAKMGDQRNPFDVSPSGPMSPIDIKPADIRQGEPKPKNPGANVPLLPPTSADEKKPETKPADQPKPPLTPPDKPKDTKPTDPKPGDPKPTPPLNPPPAKDPTQPMPKPGEKKPDDKKPEKSEKK